VLPCGVFYNNYVPQWLRNIYVSISTAEQNEKLNAGAEIHRICIVNEAGLDSRTTAFALTFSRNYVNSYSIY